jgi:exosortase
MQSDPLTVLEGPLSLCSLSSLRFDLRLPPHSKPRRYRFDYLDLVGFGRIASMPTLHTIGGMPSLRPSDPPPIPSVESARPQTVGQMGGLEWALIAACGCVLLYFFAFFKIFTNGTQTTWEWAWLAWNPENNQEHAVLVLPIAIGLILYRWRDLKAAPKQPSNAGLAFVAMGIGMFLLGVRCLQPRFAICALPLLIYGGVRFLWGRAVGRIFIFPCLFLLFMIPVGGFVQGTVSLQLLVSSSVKALSALIGVKIEAIGTTLRALDGSFDFEIAEGCSGIRSLMAMTMLSALYVHFTQKEAWKQFVIFAGSVVFALIGNVGRVFTVILFARFISPRIAGGIYHDYSGFIFFPVAVLAMLAFSRLLNHEWQGSGPDIIKPVRPIQPAEAADVQEKKIGSPISYDY